MNAIPIALAASPAIIAINLAGCTSETNTAGPETTPPPPTVDAHAGHAQATEGPHHGDLVELGNEEYHAELLPDENSVTINTMASPNSSSWPHHPMQTPPWTIIAFVSSDPELAGHIDEDGADPRLVLSISGKSYRGEIKHAHAGHNH